MKDYERAMNDTPGHHHYDIWWKVAQAVRPPQDFIPQKIFHSLRAKYWVAHPDLRSWSHYPHHTSKNIADQFNAHTPYTDIPEFHSGAVWTIANKHYMRDILKGRVPQYSPHTLHEIAVIDCRAVQDKDRIQHGGFLEYPLDGTKAPFPGPWPAHTPFFQFNVNAANKVDQQGVLTPQMNDHIKELYDFVAEHTSAGRQILFYCNQGQYRSVAAAAACFKPFVPEPYDFLYKLRPLAHPDLPYQHAPKEARFGPPLP